MAHWRPSTGCAALAVALTLSPGPVFWVVSSMVSSGQRRWTEVPAGELAVIDTKPVVEELAVDEEQLSATKPADASDTAGSKDDAVPAAPQATPQDRGHEPQRE